MFIWRAVFLASLIAVTGCGKDDGKPAPVKPASSSPSIVGRWERMQTCDELAHALDRVGLKPIVPGVIGDFFPNVSARRLARKPDPCAGAAARPHSHFFTKDGLFGSVDDQGKQVDDGSYRLIDGHTLRINDGRFAYHLDGNGVLSLTPVISARARQHALARPTDPGIAGWQVAVSYPGLRWKRVACDSWC
jgi:hypothetical protein